MQSINTSLKPEQIQTALQRLGNGTYSLQDLMDIRDKDQIERQKITKELEDYDKKINSQSGASCQRFLTSTVSKTCAAFSGEFAQDICSNTDYIISTITSMCNGEIGCFANLLDAAREITLPLSFACCIADTVYGACNEACKPNYDSAMQRFNTNACGALLYTIYSGCDPNNTNGRSKEKDNTIAKAALWTSILCKVGSLGIMNGFTAALNRSNMTIPGFIASECTISATALCMGANDYDSYSKQETTELTEPLITRNENDKKILDNEVQFLFDLIAYIEDYNKNNNQQIKNMTISRDSANINNRSYIFG